MKKFFWRAHLVYLAMLYAAAFIFLLHAYSSILLISETDKKQQSRTIQETTDSTICEALPMFSQLAMPFGYADHY
jgi:hypothetical protein